MKAYLIECYGENKLMSIEPRVSHYRLAFAPDADALDARLKDGGGSIVDTMTSEEDEREIWCVEIPGDGLCQAFEIAL